MQSMVERSLMIDRCRLRFRNTGSRLLSVRCARAGEDGSVCEDMDQLKTYDALRLATAGASTLLPFCLEIW